MKAQRPEHQAFMTITETPLKADTRGIWQYFDMAAKLAELHGGMKTLDMLVAERAREFTPAALPKDVRRGEPNLCFLNAWDLAEGGPLRAGSSLGYVEGYAISSHGFGLPLLHAWCVTADGKVVDPTWDYPDYCAYVGVVLDPDYVRRVMLETESYSVLGNLWRLKSKELLSLVPDERFAGAGTWRTEDASEQGLRGSEATVPCEGDI